MVEAGAGGREFKGEGGGRERTKRKQRQVREKEMKERIKTVVADEERKER